LALVLLLAAPASAQFPNIGVGDGRWQIAGVPVSTTSPTDSMAAGTQLTGARRWDLALSNGYSSAFDNPTISVSTSLDPSWFAGGHQPGSSTWSSLGANASLLWEFYLSQSAGSGLLNFTPGYDSSRTVSPLIVPPGISQQTVTITVTARDQRYYSNSMINPSSGIGILMPGATILSIAGPSNLTPGVEAYYSGLGLANPQLNKPYTFTVVVQVDNPASSPMVNKPGIAVVMMVFNPGSSSSTSGTSMTIADTVLGTITYSVGQSANWGGGIQDNYNLTYNSVTAPPADRTPPVISGMPSNCTLWPANHKMVQVATVSAADAPGPDGLPPSGLASLSVSATSNEPANGLGDGNTASDIAITSLGGPLGPYVVQLRAERSGTGAGRVYTITATAMDLAGNSATATAVCTVAHNQ